MSRSIAVLLALAGLAGCQRYNQVEFDRMVQFEPAPLYCYRSLGYAVCYAKPLSDDQTDRLFGYYGPPPPLIASGTTIPARTITYPDPGPRPPAPPEPQPRMPVGSEPLPRVAPPPAPASP
jgi:hypothetical protein